MTLLEFTGLMTMILYFIEITLLVIGFILSHKENDR